MALGVGAALRKRGREGHLRWLYVEMRVTCYWKRGKEFEGWEGILLWNG